MTFKCATVGP